MRDTLIADLKNRGCSQLEAVLVFQVYCELCEIKKYWDVEYEFKETQGPFIHGKKHKSGPTECFIPISINRTLNFLQINQYLQQFCEYERIFMVFVHPDSTCVYYEIKNGLIEVTDTQAKHLKEDKHEIINVELKRNQAVLEDAAICGLPVSISRKKVKTQINDNK